MTLIDHVLPSALDRAASGPMPELRVEHDPNVVGGIISRMAMSNDGLVIAGKVDPQGRVYTAMRDGRLTGLSIGFDGIAEPSGAGRIFVDISLTEVSLVEFPANVGSRVQALKSFRECNSARDFEGLLRSVGLSRRQATKAVAVAWPVLSGDAAAQTSSSQKTLAAIARLAHATGLTKVTK